MEKLTKALSALDGSSPETQVLRESLEMAKAEAISPEPIRVSPDEALAACSGEDCEKSVLEEALQVKKEAKLTPVGERLNSCLQYREGSKEAPVVRSGSCSRANWP